MENQGHKDKLVYQVLLVNVALLVKMVNKVILVYKVRKVKLVHKVFLDVLDQLVHQVFAVVQAKWV